MTSQRPDPTGTADPRDHAALVDDLGRALDVEAGLRAITRTASPGPVAAPADHAHAALVADLRHNLRLGEGRDGLLAAEAGHAGLVRTLTSRLGIGHGLAGIIGTQSEPQPTPLPAKKDSQADVHLFTIRAAPPTDRIQVRSADLNRLLVRSREIVRDIRELLAWPLPTPEPSARLLPLPDELDRRYDSVMAAAAVLAAPMATRAANGVGRDPSTETSPEESHAELVEQLVAEGRIDELTTLADAGDPYAAGRLVDVLHERRMVDELRQRAEAGHSYAEARLSDLLRKPPHNPVDIIHIKAHVSLGFDATDPYHHALSNVEHDLHKTAEDLDRLLDRVREHGPATPTERSLSLAAADRLLGGIGRFLETLNDFEGADLRLAVIDPARAEDLEGIRWSTADGARGATQWPGEVVGVVSRNSVEVAGRAGVYEVVFGARTGAGF
nr:hypothetical protein GCM10020063_050130 [Dactylosporangium thailandense]